MAVITDEEFNKILMDIVEESDSCTFLQMDGFYAMCSEYFNNEVIEKWEKQNDNEE